MQIVIDIDEDYIKIINKNGASNYPEEVIKNGIPLPKGHGRIIDESQVTGTFIWDNKYIECYAPTIIEADVNKSQESEKINCKSIKCENCINHNYCDFEPQKSEE